MREQIRENYFLAVKMILVLAGEICLLTEQFDKAGASGGMFLLLALFLGLVVTENITENRWKLFFCVLLAMEAFYLAYGYGDMFLLLGMIGLYEVISCLNTCFLQGSGSLLLYVWPMVLPFLYDGSGTFTQAVIVLLVGIIYIQHDFVVGTYRRQIAEDTRQELHLKKSMNSQEHELKEQLKQGLLAAENQALEERARLAQTLHDRLGHNINGSVYQLEAAKVLLDREPDTSRAMLEAVIDRLRAGMDEIRGILRRERPEKYRLAVLQLQRLLEECRKMDIKAGLVAEGDLSKVPEKHLEIVLDNAYEAVSNALKYSSCTKMEIKLVVLNKVLRCSISDNGVGCGEIKDGMGIAGMRERVRRVNGILDITADAGFTVNMLLPIEQGENDG